MSGLSVLARDRQRGAFSSLRRILSAATAAVVTVGISAFAATSVPPLAAPTAQAATSYTWNNVKIGGGGFVDGIIFNQAQPNLVYARTDIGGAYRWDPSSGSWMPLLDWVGFDNWGYNGVVSLATDAVDPDRVYIAAGMYTNSWDLNDGAILRSDDQGATWQVTPLPFKLGGNMPGRGMGERLAIDPNNDSVLYFGAPSGHGLWRSTDKGLTWSQVTSFPDVGTYAADPSDTTGYQSDIQGVVWVDFDKSSGSAGQTTQNIYVGVADPNNPVWRSTDGGATWEAVPGAPTGYLPHKGVLDSVNHILYVATSDTGGPYDGAKGDVWKYDITTGTWTLISPIPSTISDDYFGYSGLTIDRQHPNTIMVATQVSWWPDAIFFRSTDGGTTWTRIWDFTSYPDRSLRYNLDDSSEPWLTFGVQPQPPVPSPKLGWMNESVEIDPFNSDRMLYGTGATLYATNDLTNWDAGGKIDIAPMVNGLEETAVQDLISPPSGAPLFSALGDIGGFKHTDLSAVPSLMYTQPTFTTTTSMDFAELNPTTVVRAGNVDTSATPVPMSAGFSTDGGTSWFQPSSEPSGITAGGFIAEAADGGATVWAPQGASVSYSTTYGSSWTASTGIPSGAQVRSDRVNPKTFYGFSANTFYRSTDGGKTFTATAATGLPSTGNAYFKAVPGHDGDIWLAGGSTTGAYGLWHSTDGGDSFTQLANVDQADNVGYGKAAPGQTYPALYIIAKVGGVRGVFRSDDAGRTWVRINDDRHQYGNIGQAITGDPRIYGRVYLGTNGRGIMYGDISSGGGDSQAPSVPSGLAVSGTTSSSVSLSWSASSDNVGVAGYDILRNGTQVGTSTTTSFTDSGLSASTAYSYAVKAFDAAGNTSAASAAVSATTAASSGGGGGGGAVSVLYKNNDSAPGDNQIKPGLELVNDGSSALDLSTVTVRYYFTHDAGATAYTYSCDYAAIGCGNVHGTFVSMSSPTASADTYLQLSFTGSLAAGANSGDLQNRINKSDWSNFDETNDYSYATNTAYGANAHVTVYVGGTLVAGTEPGGTTGGGDTTAPTAPTGLKVTGTTASSVALSWTASTDNVGVTGYQVFRGTTLVGTSTTASFSDTGLSASTQYSYTVKAVDAAGNVSAASSAVTATTAAASDTTPPSAPTGVTVGGTTSSSVSLSWTAATDNVGVTGYQVFRGSTLVGSPTTTSFNDTGLAASTAYTYTVKAVDAAGNVSAASSAVSATTAASSGGGGSTVTDCTTPTNTTGTTSLQGGEYLFQQNEWNSTLQQCATINPSTGAWSLSTANFNTSGGAPATYPSSYMGCHWGLCTSNSGLPIQVSNLGSATSSWSTTQVSSGAYDVAYDIWFNSTPTTTGQPDGTEMMIWLNSRGGVQPFGSQTATGQTVAGHTWNVWQGNQTSWKIISYVLTPGATSISNLDIKAIINDAVARGSLNPAHYLIDSEVGFEVWQGGQGLGTNSYTFSATAGSNSGGDTTPPSAPTGLKVTGTTSSSVSLSWTASTDNVGVTGYQVFRGSTLVGSPTTTSFTDSGLNASTAYTYTVKAVDAAGNVSAASSAVTGTTAASSGGGGTGGCTATFHNDNDWGNGFNATITVTNTGTTNTKGWKVTWTWGGNQQIVNYWNATVASSGSAVTATNLDYNGSIAAGGNTSFGLQASYTGSNAAPTLTCTAS